MKILKVFGLIIFLISFMISLIMINGLIQGMEPVDWEKPISIGAFILTIYLGYFFRKTLLKILLIPFQVFKGDMNKNQRLILAISIPIILFFIALTIAYYTGVTTHTTSKKVTSMFGRKLSSPSISKITIPKISKIKINKISPIKPNYFTTTTYNHNPFDWGKTWYVWLLSLTFCCIFEYKLFADKKEK